MNTENLKTETTTPVPSPNRSTPTNPPDHPAPASGRSKVLVIGATVVAAALVLALGILPRLRAHEQLVQAVQETAHPTVVVTNVTHAASSPEIMLPASVRAFEQAALYARANGYLKKWNVDIGGTVEAGQVLAEIDTPELDQELNQSRATLAQAQANLVLAKSTSERWQGLLKDRAVSQQEVDEKAGALAARQADVNAADAAVQRLAQLTSFQQITAPFAGIVTRRNVDTGALILAGGGSSATPLFELARVNTLRVFVDVPQAHMREITVDLSAEIKVSEFPERTFTGKVVRTAGALDPVTRTLLTEVQVDNRDGALMPGIHAEVKLKLVQNDPPIVVPASSVMSRSEGNLVAVVHGGQTIHLQKVQLGRDLGTSIEVVSGLADHSVIVLNPSDTLKDGMQILAQGSPAAAPTPLLAKK